MRQLKIFWLLSVGAAAAISFDVLPAKVAQAQQEVRIVSPQEGQDVRGEITARFEGIPAGGYAVVKIDGQFQQASAQDFVVLDTISDRVTFARGDATYKMEVTVLNSGGKQVGTSTVNFNVANSKVEANGKPVRLVHWSLNDSSNGTVQRFRVFAESDATMSGGTGASSGGAPSGGRSGGKGGGMMGGGDGVAASGGSGGGAAGGYIAAPLDFQVSALMRRVLRDTNMLNGSANISTIVQEGFERQREEPGVGGMEQGGAGRGAASPSRKKGAASNGLSKAPWSEDGKGNALWNAAPETGKYFIKMIQPNGTEVNATRKAPSLALADLLPTFPDVPVRPGSTWGTTMSFVGELSSRTPINVKDAPMTFTSYEDLQTPGGETRRCAKLESRFRLPDNLAKRIAATLANKSGGAGGGAGGAAAGMSTGTPNGGGPDGGGASGEAAGLTEDDIQVARTDVARVIWFDVQRRRILRAEDTIRSNFEMPATATTTSGGMPGAGMPNGMPPGMGGAIGMSNPDSAPAAPAEPQTVNYNLSVTTWLDDRVPNPTGQYLPGGAGAHTRDSVAEPGLSRILRGNVPMP